MTILQNTFDARSIRTFHAHVYFDGIEQLATAAHIREQAKRDFDVQLGRWRTKPVGPHPLPMYQITFYADQLTEILPWLMSVRGKLSILIHAQTERSDLMDHTAGAMWLGPALNLKLDFFDIDGKSA